MSRRVAGFIWRWRYLLTATPARDVEITSRNLEDAFLALTTDGDDR